MEDGNFQGRGAQATPTPHLGEVIVEAGEQEGAVTSPGQAEPQHRAQMSHNLSLPNQGSSFACCRGERLRKPEPPQT